MMRRLRAPAACAGAARQNGPALLSPGVARRFPFSALLRTRSKVFFRVGYGATGEIANDDQSQRALGLDTRDGALCGLTRGVLHDRAYRGRDFENRNRDGHQFCQTGLAPPEAVRASQT